MARDQVFQDNELARLYAEYSTDFVCLVDTRGVVAWVAGSIASSLGWKPDQLVGHPLLDFVDPEDRGLLLDLAEGLQAGRAVGTEPRERLAARLRTPAGAIRWVSGTGIPRQDSDGRVREILVILRDVTELLQARLQAETNANQWRATVDSMIDPFVVMTPVRDEDGEIRDFVFSQANSAAASELLVEIDDLIGSHFLTMFPHLEDQGVLHAYATVMATGDPLVVDDAKLFNDVLGEPRRYDLRAAKAGDELVLTWRDVTERHDMLQELAHREAVYRMATESEYDAVVQVDARGDVMWASHSFERISGYFSEDLVGSSAFVLVADEDRADIEASLAAALSGRLTDSAEVRMVRADGTRRWVSLRSMLVENPMPDAPPCLMSLVRDIDSEVNARQAVERSLQQDALTGVATWSVLRPALDNDRPSAVLCISVDRLRAINEAVSYAGGDELLVEVARRISAAIPPSATVGRIAGSEFLVALPEAEDRTLLGIVAERISAEVSTPVSVAGQDVLPTVSIGIAHADARPDELLRRASLAMRTAKNEGGDRWLFDDPVVAAEAERRLWVESRVRKAVSDRAIVPWFQPVVRLRDGVVIGHEALARWPQADGGVQLPGQFLNVAETSGLVVAVDFAILEQSLAAFAQFDPLTVSVNVSARTLATADYAERVAAVLDETAFEPARLRLEVTETALLYDADAADRATNALALRGVKWWLDDFGTGYSTLTHLRDFPISGIKLDRSFTVGVGDEDLASTRLAKALIGMAHGLGLETVAEGVENTTQARLLREQGWQNAQGWLYGKAAPLPK
ncbi:MAG: EAL domain-containing protein [Actinobacteria bacterium]|nr:EAL domain-containing protein [Actinomycetota bacterium]MCB8996227.1 EAL domain-containing protein [Actinomycetota bacterium]MCB9413898.1 EAL domain-containing protein [Actinomycetota bacterium]